MSTLIWKKWRETVKTPVKFVFALLLPVILFIINYYILHVDFTGLFILLPLVTTTFSTYLFFQVDDLAYSIYFIALGIKMHSVWLTNLLFVTVIEYILTELVLLGFFIVLQPSITYIAVLLNLGNFITALAFIGLSTIHYHDSEMFTTILASVFAVLNLLLLVLPPLAQLTDRFEVINSIFVLVSLITIVICTYKMKRVKQEQLIMNTQIYIYGYDNKFIEEE